MKFGRRKVFPQALHVAGFLPASYSYSTTESGHNPVQSDFPHLMIGRQATGAKRCTQQTKLPTCRRHPRVRQPPVQNPPKFLEHLTTPTSTSSSHSSSRALAPFSAQIPGTHKQMMYFVHRFRGKLLQHFRHQATTRTIGHVLHHLPTIPEYSDDSDLNLPSSQASRQSPLGRGS